MDDEVWTICTKCVHKKVCGYKQVYLKYLKAYEKMHKEYEDDISFIEKIDLGCKYYAP
ncbi:MAG: hypothetical protein NC548_52445 [Lachnospiraceae bacterium]|nr:hypothetical protein [Lachnospiraceae bacterium]